MLSIVIYSIVCFFALYGILELIILVLKHKSYKNFKVFSEPYAVLCVSNQEDYIESAIRSIVWQMNTQSGIPNCINNLVVIDLGSNDETPEILCRLSQEYEFINIMSKEEYLNFISKL